MVQRPSIVRTENYKNPWAESTVNYRNPWAWTLHSKSCTKTLDQAWVGLLPAQGGIPGWLRSLVTPCLEKFKAIKGFTVSSSNNLRLSPWPPFLRVLIKKDLKLWIFPLFLWDADVPSTTQEHLSLHDLDSFVILRKFGRSRRIESFLF